MTASQNFEILEQCVGKRWAWAGLRDANFRIADQPSTILLTISNQIAITSSYGNQEIVFMRRAAGRELSGIIVWLPWIRAKQKTAPRWKRSFEAGPMSDAIRNYCLSAPKPPRRQERQIPNVLPLPMMLLQRFVMLARSPTLRVAERKGVSVMLNELPAGGGSVFNPPDGVVQMAAPITPRPYSDVPAQNPDAQAHWKLNPPN